MHHHTVPEDGADLQMAEACVQLPLQIDTGKPGLVEHQTGKRGQSLVLESDFRDAMGLLRRMAALPNFIQTVSIGLTGCFADPNLTNFETVFFMPGCHFIASVFGVFWNSLPVKSRYYYAMCVSRCI